MNTRMIEADFGDDLGATGPQISAALISTKFFRVDFFFLGEVEVAAVLACHLFF